MSERKRGEFALKIQILDSLAVARFFSSGNELPLNGVAMPCVLQPES